MSTGNKYNKGPEKLVAIRKSRRWAKSSAGEWALPDNGKKVVKELKCIACPEKFATPAQLEYHTQITHQKKLL